MTILGSISRAFLWPQTRFLEILTFPTTPHSIPVSYHYHTAAIPLYHVMSPKMPLISHIIPVISHSYPKVSHNIPFIELDDGKIYRKALYLMVKTHGFPVNFPLNQSSEPWILPLPWLTCSWNIPHGTTMFIIEIPIFLAGIPSF